MFNTFGPVLKLTTLLEKRQTIDFLDKIVNDDLK